MYEPTNGCTDPECEACKGAAVKPKSWDPALARESDRMQRHYAPRNYGPLPEERTLDVFEEMERES